MPPALRPMGGMPTGAGGGGMGMGIGMGGAPPEGIDIGTGTPPPGGLAGPPGGIPGAPAIASGCFSPGLIMMLMLVLPLLLLNCRRICMLFTVPRPRQVLTITLHQKETLATIWRMR